MSPGSAVPGNTAAAVDTRYLQGLLGYNARRVSLQAVEQFTGRMSAYGLSPVDFSVLSLVHHNPGITSRQLCSALNLLPPNLVGKITHMQKRKLLMRAPHPQDGRAIGLHLTEAGIALMQKAENTVTQMETEVTGKLSAAEAKTLLRLLQKVYL